MAYMAQIGRKSSGSFLDRRSMGRGGILGQKGLGTKTKFAEQIGGQTAEQNPFLESFLSPKIASNRLKMTPKMGWFS